MSNEIEILLKDKNFFKKNQFDKRAILEKYILKQQSAKIGLGVLCFDLEPYCNALYFYRYQKKKLIKTLTPGKIYTIVDVSIGKIKIENDLGKKNWYTINRFLNSIKLERLAKLKKIQKISEEC